MDFNRRSTKSWERQNDILECVSYETCITVEKNILICVKGLQHGVFPGGHPSKY